MNDFLAQTEKLKGILAKIKAVCEGTAVDNINLSTLKNTAEQVANTCFAGGNMSPAQKIARKDAYDFVVSLSRLADFTALTRSDYYDECANSVDIVTERVDYLKATTLILESAGPK